MRVRAMRWSRTVPQKAPGEPAPGDGRERRNVGERAEDERALVHPRVRHREPGEPDPAATKEQQIEVERTRRVAPRLGIAAPEVAALDRMQRGEQCARTEYRAHGHDARSRSRAAGRPRRSVR